MQTINNTDYSTHNSNLNSKLNNDITNHYHSYIIESFMLNIFRLYNESYILDLNYYKLIETDKVNYILKFIANTDINHMNENFQYFIELNIEVKKYCIYNISEYLSINKNNIYKFGEIFTDEDQQDPSKELIKLLYPETDIFYKNTYNMENDESSTNFLKIQNGKSKDIIRNMTNFLQDIIFFDFQKTLTKLEKLEISKEEKHTIISDYFEHLMIRPLIFISNNITVMKSHCSGNGLFLLFNLITITIGHIYNYYCDNFEIKKKKLSEKEKHLKSRNYRIKPMFMKSRIEKQKLEQIQNILLKIQTLKNYDNMETYTEFLKFTISIIEEKNKKLILLESKKLKSCIKRYKNNLNNTETKSLTLISLLNFSDPDKGINFSLEIMKYLLEKIGFKLFDQFVPPSSENKENEGNDANVYEVEESEESYESEDEDGEESDSYCYSEEEKSKKESSSYCESRESIVQYSLSPHKKSREMSEEKQSKSNSKKIKSNTKNKGEQAQSNNKDKNKLDDRGKKFFTFTYLTIMSVLYARCNVYFQDALLKSFQKLQILKTQMSINPQNNNDKNLISQYKEHFSFEFYTVSMDKFFFEIIINILLILLENFKHHKKNNRELHTTLFGAINQFIMYSCEGNGKVHKKLYFSGLIAEFWNWILLATIDLVEEYSIQSSSVIDLANLISTTLLSMYQDTDINIINNGVGGLLTNNLKLYKKSSKIIFSDKIFKSDLIMTYINLMTLSKMIITVEISQSNFFEKKIFPVKKCLNIISDFIKIFHFRCIETEKQKKENALNKNFSIFDLIRNKSLIKQDTDINDAKANNRKMKDYYDYEKIKDLRLCKKELYKIYEYYKNDLKINSIYNSDYFKLASELYLYLNQLKILENVNAVRYLSFNVAEELLYNEDLEEENQENMNYNKNDLIETEISNKENLNNPVLASDSLWEKHFGWLFCNKKSIVKMSEKQQKDSVIIENVAFYFFSKILRCVEFNFEDTKTICKNYKRTDKINKSPPISKKNINRKSSKQNAFGQYHIDSNIDEVYKKSLTELILAKYKNTSRNSLRRVNSNFNIHLAEENFKEILHPNVDNRATDFFSLSKTNKSKNENILDGLMSKKLVLKKVYFISNPVSTIIKPKQIKKLLHDAGSSEREKIRSILEFYEEFQSKIIFHQKFITKSTLLSISMRCDYNYVDLSSFIIGFIINLIQLIFFDTSLLQSPKDNVFLVIEGLSIFLILFNTFFLILYAGTKQKEIDYLSFIKAQNDGIIFSKIEVAKMYFYNFFFDENKICMFANIVICCFAVLKKSSFLFSLLLFTVIKFTDTTKLIANIFFMKFFELFSMIGFLAMLTYAFANLGFFYMNDQFQGINITNSPSNATTNVCGNLIECFITFFSNGIHLGGGIAEVLNFVNFSNLSTYFKRWFMDFLYFVLVNLLLLNMVNGVIISPFGQIREENDKKKEDMDNRCFICSIDKSVFQQYLVTFEDHKDKSHNVRSYIEYLIYLNNKDDKDLDANEYSLREKIKRKDISCFPIKKALDDEGKLIEENNYEI